MLFAGSPDRTLLRMLLLSLSLHVALLMIVQPTRVKEASVTPPITARLENLQPMQEPSAPAPLPASPEPVRVAQQPVAEMAPAEPQTVNPREQPLAQEQKDAAVPALAPVPVPAAPVAAAPAPQPTAASAKIPAKSNASAPDAPPAANPPALPSMPVMLDTNWYTVRQLDTQPRQLQPVQPVYPPQARRRGVEGAVKLMLKIDENGVVQEIRVEEGEPPGVFDVAALEAFRAARFSPAKINQRPVRAQVYVRVVFRLE